MSPFDKARYSRLLKGLDVSEVLISQLEFSGRLDAEYYRLSHLQAEKRVLLKGAVALESLCDFVIGPFGSSFTVENYSDEKIYRYIRGKDVKNMFIVSNDNVYMPKSDFERLSKHSLQSGDVLVSVVGTIGNSALIESEHLPAIFSCKSTALRAHSIDPRYLVTYLNCHYGKSLLIRKERGAIQKGLNLDDLKSLLIYSAAPNFQKKIAGIHHRSLDLLVRTKQFLIDAESLLEKELGLVGWEPPEMLSCIRNSREVFATGRLDAQFFAPRVEQLLQRLGRDGLRIGDVAPARHERFEPRGSGVFNYIEIGSVGTDGTAASEPLQMGEAPSRATQYVRGGDVVTSTVRPIRRLSALITPSQDGDVASSGFVVLKPSNIASEVLLTYLRLKPVCELMDLFTSASMYPAISEADLLALPIPVIPDPVQTSICSKVRDAAATRAQSAHLLDAVRSAVEIAIEDSEAAALTYLEDRV